MDNNASNGKPKKTISGERNQQPMAKSLPIGMFIIRVVQAPVVQRVDSAIHRINHYPAGKCWENTLDYPLDSDLSGG